MVNQGLLKTLTECEYPTEFLVARLLGKKSTLFRNWESLIASSDRLQNLQNSPFYPYLKKYGTSGIWRFLQDEHLWVYSRMNPFLRKTFTPYFVYHELNTLLVCLRYLYSKKEIESVQQELLNSLLHYDIQKILVSGLDFPVTLLALESCLCKQYELFKGLSELYEKKGITALEIFIRDCFFAIIISQKQPTMLKHFMQYLIDFHNCIFLAKTLRWQTETEPDVISGGTIPGVRFRKAYFRKDMTPVVKFLHLDASGESTAEIQKLEISLLISITRKLKNRSYQRTVVGDILFYLWEQYRYTRNISMVLNTILLDDVTVLKKIVA